VTWVVWRQHRLEGLWALLTAVLLAASIGFVAHELSITPCPAQAPPGGGPGPGVTYCLPGDFWGSLAQGIVLLNLYQYGLVVLPALAGAFVGAPLVAREIENGTARLAWTQGVTRTHWLLVKLALVFVPLLVGAAAVGILEVVLINVQGPQANRWAFFDQQAPMTVGSTAFALALAVAAGSLLRKSIPAMAATLLGFAVTRIGIAELARPHYLSSLAFTTNDSAALSAMKGSQTAWWLDQFQFRSNVMQQYHYQPGDRFWTFQTIETAILMGLAALLLAFTVYWVTRRVS
jgi:ABC-type transport system involved in multi-copper enzyme maturation permease subunit